MILHARQEWEGGSLAVVEAKREVGANCSENEEKIKDKKRWSLHHSHWYVHNTQAEILLYVRCVCLICLLFVRSSCARVSYKIRKNCDIFRRLQLVYEWNSYFVSFLPLLSTEFGKYSTAIPSIDNFLVPPQFWLCISIPIVLLNFPHNFSLTSSISSWIYLKIWQY